MNITGIKKVNYKNFLKDYDEAKDLYNVRNSQNIREIRDIINKELLDLSEAHHERYFKKAN